MLVCNKCGAEIPEGANFCPQCADPVTSADVVAPKTEQMALVCPKCESQASYKVDPSRSVYTFNCMKCHRDFTTQIVQIRAKRSRGDKRKGKRHFSVRVMDPSGAERLIEFENASYEDFELRSRDQAAFSYKGQKLKIVQNLTVARYMKVSKPGCFLATYLYGPISSEVTLLRCFRDDVLLGYGFLSPLVTSYYRISPLMVKHLGGNRAFRAVLLLAMKPIVFAVGCFLSLRKERLASR